MNYVSFSGGKDSTALAVYLKQKGIDYKLVFADTGAEFPETHWAVTHIARQLGKELIVIPTPGFTSRLIGWGYLLPSFKVRWCTKELKQAPLDRFFKPEDTVFVGINADESHRLEGTKRAYDLQRPMVDHDIGEKEVAEIVHADVLNPLYTWRSSCSCFCCYQQRIGDWYGMLRHYPQFYMVAELWEEESIARSKKPFTWIRGKRLKTIRENYQAQGQLLPDEPVTEEPCAWCAT
jgi:predicted phosphoadenosine phosphosulfate sulfurtransferase